MKRFSRRLRRRWFNSDRNRIGRCVASCSTAAVIGLLCSCASIDQTTSTSGPNDSLAQISGGSLPPQMMNPGIAPPLMVMNEYPQAGVAPAAVESRPAEPRRAIQSVSFEEAAVEIEQSGNHVYDPRAVHEHPDEYIFDGGDRGLPMHYEGPARAGLESEDTIGEYRDDSGRARVTVSNRVAIYAPRFSSVRSVSVPHAGSAIEQIGRSISRTRNDALRNRTAITNHQQRLGSERVLVRSRASGLDSEAIRHRMQQITRVSGHTKLANLYEDFAFLRSGRLRQADEASLASAIAAAETWTQNTFPVISSSPIAVHELASESQPDQIIEIDDGHKTPGQLRVIKLADKESAESGDVITFTLRYDNLGDRDVSEVRIIDKLTPRLEFVEESASSDREGDIVVEMTEDGSIMLIFEFAEPLPGKTGGVITFQAVVR